MHLLFNSILIDLNKIKNNYLYKSYINRAKREFEKRINYKRKEALIRGRNLLNIYLEEKLINNIKFKKSKNPIVTVIVLIYISETYIKKIMRSIQNQSMLDIEIILVNDASTDNTLKIIEELQKEEPRIELINNEKNMGILYSKFIGILNTKGKYILPLVHDDFFFDEDIFEIFYKEVEKTNFNMISFSFMDI